MIFSVFQKNWVCWVLLVNPTVVSVLLSASVERCFVSRMRDFFLQAFGVLQLLCYNKLSRTSVYCRSHTMTSCWTRVNKWPWTKVVRLLSSRWKAFHLFSSILPFLDQKCMSCPLSRRLGWWPKNRFVELHSETKVGQQLHPGETGKAG